MTAILIIIPPKVQTLFETEAWLLPGDQHDSEASFISHHPLSETNRAQILNYADAEKSENGSVRAHYHFGVSFTSEACLLV
jgi:hypothetical protein